LEKSLSKVSFFPPENTVKKMKIGDITGFTLGEKHWLIQRDE